MYVSVLFDASFKLYYIAARSIKSTVAHFPRFFHRSKTYNSDTFYRPQFLIGCSIAISSRLSVNSFIRVRLRPTGFLVRVSIAANRLLSHHLTTYVTSRYHIFFQSSVIKYFNIRNGRAINRKRKRACGSIRSWFT